MLLFLPSSLLSFLWIPCRTQASPWIIKAPRPHLTSLHNEATLLPCPGLCEAHKHLLTGLCVSRWAGECLRPSPGVCPGSFPCFHSQSCPGWHFQMMQNSLQPRTTGPNWPDGIDQEKCRDRDGVSNFTSSGTDEGRPDLTVYEKKDPRVCWQQASDESTEWRGCQEGSVTLSRWTETCRWAAATNPVPLGWSRVTSG